MMKVSKIPILILIISVLLVPYFIFQFINGINHQVGIGSLINSGFMTLLLFVAIALIISHWKSEKNGSK